VAFALDHWELATLPVALWTRSGRRLDVKGQLTPAGFYEDAWLVGEAQMVFRGVLI
jgi:hypothetical protein